MCDGACLAYHSSIKVVRTHCGSFFTDDPLHTVGFYINYEQIPYVHACKTRSPTVDMRIVRCLGLPHILMGWGRTIMSVPYTKISWGFFGTRIVYVWVSHRQWVKNTSKILSDKSTNEILNFYIYRNMSSHRTVLTDVGCFYKAGSILKSSQVLCQNVCCIIIWSLDWK